MWQRTVFTSTLLVAGHLVLASSDDNSTAYLYLDNVPYLAATNNIVPMSLDALTAAFAQPNVSDTATFSGYDWTQPFPGTPTSGFAAHLHVAYDVPFPNTLVKQNASSAVSALTFSNPAGLMMQHRDDDDDDDDANGDATTKPMDASWYVCQHIWVSSSSSVADTTTTNKMDHHTCGFLGEECLADLRSNLTERWGHFDPNVPCSGQIFDLVPASCQSVWGLGRADIQAWDAPTLSDAEEAKLLTVDRFGQYSWKMGTGFHDLGDRNAYQTAANRTFLVATVWGYSASADKAKIQTPDVSLACLQASVASNGTAVSGTSNSPPQSNRASTSNSAPELLANMYGLLV